MARIGKIFYKSSYWLVLLMLFVVAPLVGRSHANKQQAAAHDKWGQQLTGKMVKYTSPVFGDAYLPVRTADIKFTGHNGEPVTVNRVIYYKNKPGDTFPLWQAKDGSVFVKYDQGHTGSFSLRNLSGLPYRTGPWPTTQGTYLWRLILFGGAGALIAILMHHLGRRLEQMAYKKQRAKLTIAKTQKAA